ncbi:GNAT family N-acetyltransferase [Alicyclobacillus sp. ALC3]|uniref:GNAT family N-acetyltransferase n=1 Tax=Alicyclobacillus sp. ALC3 TaxID=2796143 RepID=UPI00308387B9
MNGRWEDHLYFAIVNSIRRARTDEGPILSDLAFRSKAVWGGATMVSRGRVFHLADLNSLIAKSGGEYVGAVTYRFEDNGDCELISINTTGRGTGVGTNLLAAVEGEARHVETQPDVLGASALSPLVPDTCS